MRAAQCIYLFVATVLLTGCTGADTTDPHSAPVQLPPGDALPSRVDAMLYGSAQSCRKDSECPGQVCYYGSCIGLLIVDQRWMQDAISERLQAEVAGHEALRSRIVSHLERVLNREDTDLAFRARSLIPLEALNAEQSIRHAFKSTDAGLRDAAALALTRLGLKEALALVATLAEHREPAIACEALRALGESQQPEALVALLSTLNPVFSDMVLRAALGGLADLGDKRAVRPLIDFLRDGPDHLRHTVARTLRTITGEPMGLEASTWVTWLASGEIPVPPAYAIRAASSEADLGIPTP